MIAHAAHTEHALFAATYETPAPAARGAAARDATHVFISDCPTA